SLAGYLVDPKGMILSTEGNVDLTGARQGALQMFRATPEAGRWRFILQEVQSSGASTSTPFTARIDFNSALVSASGMPKGAQLSASGDALPVPVTVTHTGVPPKAYLAAARVDAYQAVDLTTGPCGQQTTLPGFCGLTTVPPRAKSVTFTASASVPITMDAL